MGRYQITIEGASFEVELDSVTVLEGRVDVRVDGDYYSVHLLDGDARLAGPARFIIEGRPYEIQVDEDFGWMRSRWGMHQLALRDLETTQARLPIGDGRIKAPIPGQITQVFVKTGERVKTGQPLLVLEAMKMENEIRANCDGLVQTINVHVGHTVSLHQVLLEIA